MNRPKCLDLFCGAGGASEGLHRAGFDVTGVDINPQPRYPFKFIQGDALDQDLSGYDFVWASPPCQGYCRLKTMPNRRTYPKLIPEVRDFLTAWGGPWVIENVEGAKNEMRFPVMLCGSMFNLGSHGYQLRRHRYFESNFPLAAPGPCRHDRKTLGVYGASVRDMAKEKRHYSAPKATRGKPEGVVLPRAYGSSAMGIDWMRHCELVEAIPPAYSEWIGKQVLDPVTVVPDRAETMRWKCLGCGNVWTDLRECKGVFQSGCPACGSRNIMDCNIEIPILNSQLSSERK